MIGGFDRFYRRPLPGEYQQQSASNYDMIFEEGSSTENSLAGNSVGTRQIQNLAVTSTKIKNASIETAKIKDAAITNAKIQEITAEKILTSTLETVVSIGNPSSGFIRLDGPNNRILGNDGVTNTFVIQA